MINASYTGIEDEWIKIDYIHVVYEKTSAISMSYNAGYHDRQKQEKILEEWINR